MGMAEHIWIVAPPKSKKSRKIVASAIHLPKFTHINYTICELLSCSHEIAGLLPQSHADRIGPLSLFRAMPGFQQLTLQ